MLPLETIDESETYTSYLTPDPEIDALVGVIGVPTAEDDWVKTESLILVAVHSAIGASPEALQRQQRLLSILKAMSGRENLEDDVRETLKYNIRKI